LKESLKGEISPLNGLRPAPPKFLKNTEPSTFFEGENIPPQRSLRSLLPLKNRHSSFVKVASIRLLRGMSFGEMEIPMNSRKDSFFHKERKQKLAYSLITSGSLAGQSISISSF